MTIKDDILALEAIQIGLKQENGRYVQASPTPADVPMAGSSAEITKLNKPSDEAFEIFFVPTARDYQIRMDVGHAFAWRLKRRGQLF